MTPLSVVELKSDVVAAGHSAKPSPVDACVEAYQALKADPARSASDDALYFELCALITTHGFYGLSVEAGIEMGALVAANGLEHYRPPPPADPDPPEPDSA